MKILSYFDKIAARTNLRSSRYLKWSDAMQNKQPIKYGRRMLTSNKRGTPRLELKLSGVQFQIWNEIRHFFMLQTWNQCSNIAREGFEFNISSKFISLSLLEKISFQTTD
jgi:hypothetical protein